MARRTTEVTAPVPLDRAWAALWSEASWPALTDLVEAVEVIDAGDRHGNGRLRRIHQHRRWWDPTLMMERTDQVAVHRSITAVVHHHRADVRHGWRLAFESQTSSTTRLLLDEEVEVDESRYPREGRRLERRLLQLRPALLAGIS